MNETVTAARTRVNTERHYKDGVICPVCDRIAKVYKRSLNRGGLKFLYGLYKLDARARADGKHDVWFKSGRNGEKLLQTPGGEYSKMVWWGLIERDNTKRADGSTRSGFWRITAHGRKFVEGKVKVTRYIYEYDSKPLHPQPDHGKKPIDIHDVDPEFNYDAIM